MAEPALRRLDRGLPRIDMYSPAFRARQALRLNALPEIKVARPEEAQEAVALVDEARKVVATIVAEGQAEADRLVSEAERVVADAAAQASRIVSDARKMAKTIIQQVDTSPGRILVRDIIRSVAADHDVRVEDITGASRARNVVRARWAAIAAAHLARPDLSTVSLGRMFGGRDHSTIIYALRKSGARIGGTKEVA